MRRFCLLYERVKRRRRLQLGGYRLAALVSKPTTRRSTLRASIRILLCCDFVPSGAREADAYATAFVCGSVSLIFAKEAAHAFYLPAN